ncbi:MAG: cupin domain-containing protein [Candidatus Nanopelagicales bacterium]
MTCQIIARTDDPVTLSSVGSGDADPPPRAGVTDLSADGMACGLWEHTVGTSTDTEVDEIFVVLSGRARIDVTGAGSLDIGPGDIVRLTAGAQTTWHVTETLRKFWVAQD